MKKDLNVKKDLLINLSLFKAKASGYQCLGPSTVADASTFENSCPLSTWVATRYKPAPDNEFLARWQLRHTAVLSQMHELLLGKYPEAEIQMEVPLQSVDMCGNTLFGSPDAILIFPDGDIHVCDAKSGKRKQTHWIQVGLYALMIQAAARFSGEPIPKIHGFTLGYGDGQEGDCKLLSIVSDHALEEVLPEPTRKRIRNILAESGCSTMPNPIPSAGNCRFCKWKEGCPYAITASKAVIDASDLL
tara:strand:- start:815 stop:1552 length:738 start_codon:yes stop_codon:yes gene_type:complete